MQMPLHPILVHFPIALCFVVPILILVFAYMIRANTMDPRAWFIVVGLQLAVTGTGYIALETGENEEDRVEKVVNKSLIHHHEEASEIFVGSTVVVLVLLIAAFYLKKEHQLKFQMGIFLLSLFSSYLAYRAGNLGGELVYRHGAGNAYTPEEVEAPSGILPTPGMNTSESEMPVNESLKVDENEYDSSEEIEQGDIKE